MELWSDNAVCKDCGHKCHCEQPQCKHQLGVGMSDKWQYCGCDQCKCNKQVDYHNK